MTRGNELIQMVAKTPTEQLIKEIDAFYAFIAVFGYQYLTKEGTIVFNLMKGELGNREHASEKERKEP